MRIECKPEEATIARVGEVEFRKTDPRNFNAQIGHLKLHNLQAMGAKFEKELEPPEGYRFATEEDRKGPKPGKAKFWHDGPNKWVGSFNHIWADDLIYAIPLKKSCVVEGEVVTSERVGDWPDRSCVLGVKCEDQRETCLGNVLIIPKEGTVRFDCVADCVASNGLFITSNEDHQCQIAALQGKRVEVLVREL